MPLSMTDWNGEVPPAELIPEVNTMSGLRAAIASLSGDIISNWATSEGSLSIYVAEFVSMPTILLPNPRSIRNCVVEGAIETILSILSGTLISLPARSFLGISRLSSP